MSNRELTFWLAWFMVVLLLFAAVELAEEFFVPELSSRLEAPE